MFLRLQIDNFAIIEHSRIEFQEGFSVLTGETGAGKSIIMDAVGLLLGGRAQKHMIRTGADSASIQGVFFTKNEKALNFLRASHIPFEDVIIVERTLYEDRPSISEINGKVVTNAVLREFGATIAFSSFQGETGLLFKPRYQLEVLDKFCGGEQARDLRLLTEVLAKFKTLETSLKEGEKDPATLAREKDLLRYQITEISDLALEENEDEELEAEFRAQSNSSLIADSFAEMRALAYEDGGIRDLMDRFGAGLERVREYDARYGDLQREFDDIRYGFQDIAARIRDAEGQAEEDPERLEELRNRLDEINRAKRKYGNSIEEIFAFLAQSEKRMQELDAYDELRENRMKEAEALKEEAVKISKQLRARRLKMAKVVEARMEEEMADLDIRGAKFRIDFFETELSTTGLDGIRFMAATNEGESMEPLADIASGGEMSRILLAFVGIFTDMDEREILILDEIDTGMSGKTAKVVSKKMAELAKKRQLIVVSHLPQVVAGADNQYRIRKITEDGRTVSVVESLDYKERIGALAMMISGEDTMQTRETAREMMEARIKEEQ